MKRKSAAKLCSIFMLTFALVASFPINKARADTSDVWVMSQDENGEEIILNTITNEKIAKVYGYDANGEYIETPLEDYVNNLNNPMEESIVSGNKKNFTEGPRTRSAYKWRTIYIETSKTVFLSNNALQVTPDVKAITKSTSITFGNSVTVSDSFSASIGVTSEIEDSIEGEASFGWQRSLETNSNFSCTFTIPKGKTGYVVFRPRYNVTVGDLHKYYEGDMAGTIKKVGTATGFSPRKLATGFADGQYELRYR